MGEYVKYGRTEIKIGACEDMYYTSFEKYNKLLEANRLFKSEGSLAPAEYAEPDSGTRFRFPFPDEDRLRFGDIIGTHNRAIEIKLQHPELMHLGSQPHQDDHNKEFSIELLRQKLIHREDDNKLCLVIVCRNPITDNLFRIESDRDIRLLINELVKNHIMNSDDIIQKGFYRKIGMRILKGYRIGTQEQKLDQKEIPIPRLTLQIKLLKPIKRVTKRRI